MMRYDPTVNKSRETRRKELRTLWIVAASLVILALAATGCGQTPQPTEAPAPTATPAQAPAAEPTEASETELAGQISVAGSTTVQPLAERWAEAFDEMYPEVSIDVQGGGSSVGVKSAAEGQADVGNASREIKSSEMEEYPDLKVFTVAKDGIAIAVHPEVSVEDISVDEVRQVFAGEITNWSELGGSDAPITVISREEGSGTRDAFTEIVMGDSVIAETAILLPSNGAVRTTTSTTPDAIAYLSLGYLDETVKVLTVGGVEATSENVLNGSYPIQRPLNMITNGEPTPLVRAWLDYILSDAGQMIVEDEGYIPLQ